MSEGKRTGIYGRVTLGPPGAVATAHVDRMDGFRVGRVGDQLAGLELHFQQGGTPKSLTMSLGDAMFLLSCLKSFQLDEDLPFPEDPRDPNWKASDYKKRS